MKRFDFAAEVSKQLITISSAIITVVVAFYEKFFSHVSITFVFVFIVLLVFIASIIFGVFALGAIVSMVERQERADINAADAATKEQSFVKMADSSAATCAAWQQSLFAIALVLFAMVAMCDKAGIM